MNQEEMIEYQYIIDITYFNGIIETLTVSTNNIEFLMDQYQRNRDQFTWKIRTIQ